MSSKLRSEVLRRPVYWLRSWSSALVGSANYREGLYQNVFQRDLARLGIEDEFYPFGAAANYSLMYVLLRSVTELPIVNVVEFGTGQTTILLDRLSTRLWDSPEDKNMSVRSYEHDALWASRVGSEVSHAVIHAPLVDQQVAGRPCEFYDMQDSDDNDFFDLLLVDGPTGTADHSRWGALGYIERHIGGEFVIVFDDAQRFGELQTINQCRRILQARGNEFSEARYQSNKRQHVFCSSGFSAARFF